MILCFDPYQNSQDGCASASSEEHGEGPVPGIGSLEVAVAIEAPDENKSVDSGQSKRSSHSKRSSQSAQLVFETADKIKKFTKDTWVIVR